MVGKFISSQKNGKFVSSQKNKSQRKSEKWKKSAQKVLIYVNFIFPCTSEKKEKYFFKTMRKNGKVQNSSYVGKKLLRQR